MPGSDCDVSGIPGTPCLIRGLDQLELLKKAGRGRRACEKQSPAASLVLLDTDELMGQFVKRSAAAPLK